MLPARRMPQVLFERGTYLQINLLPPHQVKIAQPKKPMLCHIEGWVRFVSSPNKSSWQTKGKTKETAK